MTDTNVDEMKPLALRRVLATEVKLLNELLADEDIRDSALIGHTRTDGWDLLPFVSDERNVALVCEDEGIVIRTKQTEDYEATETRGPRVVQGAVLFAMIEPGVYEVHTMAKRSVRGVRYVRAVHDALRIMFTCSAAMELWTRVPESNKAALGLVRAVCGKRAFECASDAPGAPATFYVLSWNDWLWSRMGEEFVKRGKWFHERLDEQFSAQAREHARHADSDDHDRMVGVTCEMILCGLVQKALILYNRWAALAGYAALSVVVPQPLVLNIGDALVQVDFAKRDFMLLDVTPDDLMIVPRAGNGHDVTSSEMRVT